MIRALTPALRVRRCPLRALGLSLAPFSTSAAPAAPPAAAPAPASAPRARAPPPPPSHSASARTQAATTTTTRLSPRLSRYAPRLARLADRTGVPLPSLAVAFVVLHEVTAIVPVVLLFYLLHAFGAGAAVVAWLFQIGDAGVPGSTEDGSGGDARGRGETSGWAAVVRRWYAEGAHSVERVGSRYGVLGFEKRERGEKQGSDVVDADAKPSIHCPSPTVVDTVVHSSRGDVVVPVPRSGDAGVVADAIAAYVLVKALMPVRIAVSIAAAPAFARLALAPFRRFFRRV